MKRLILLLMLLPSLCYGQGAIIDQPTRTAGQISNTTQAWLPIWDQNGGARLTFKMSISELASLAGGLSNGDKGDITLSGSPAGSVWTVDAGKFALLAHTHTIADVTGLQAALDAKLAASVASAYGLQLLDDADAATARVTLGLGTAATQASTAFATAVHSHAIADVTNLQTTLNGKAALVHSHAIADVTGLQTALDAKAALAHTHAIADTTGLQTALDGKAALVHTHAASDIASGTFVSARFAANTIPHATLSNTSANGRLIGSPSAGATVGEITIGSGLSLSGSTLTATASGGTPGGSNTQLQYNNSGAFAGAADVTYSTGQLSITPTWSGTGTATTPLFVNITADPGPAAAASKLLDLQVSGSSKASFSKAGLLTFAGGSYGTTWPIMVAGSGSNGFAIDSGYGSAVIPMFYVKRPDGTSMLGADSNGLYVAGYLNLGTSLLSGQDCIIIRDAADILAQRRGLNAQKLSVYNTYTDGSNYERGVFDWKGTSNTLRIGTEQGGTGVARAVSIVTGGTERIGIGSAGTVSITGQLSDSGGGWFLNESGNGALRIWNGGWLQFASNPPNAVRLASVGSSNILTITNGSTGPGKLALDNVQGANLERFKMEWNTNVARIGTEKAGTGTARDFAIITDDTPRMTVSGTTGVATFSADQIRITTDKTPASATDTGVAGTVCIDDNFIYVCTATNTWKRAALSTW